MKKFIVIGYASAEAMSHVSPEQMEAGMKIWDAWKEQLGDRLLEMGSPLMGGTRLAADGRSMPSDKGVSGYSFLQAESMEEAIALTRKHPHFSYGDDFFIEIYECMAM